MTDQSKLAREAGALLPVQADRNTAAEHGRMTGRLTALDAENVLRGDWDETSDVLFFTKRRIQDQADLPALQAELAAAREALERLEAANDEVARCTTRIRYLTDLADVQPALLALEDARKAARALRSDRNAEAG